MNGYPTITIEVSISRTKKGMDHHYSGKLHVLYEQDERTERSREMTDERLIIIPDKQNAIYDDIPTEPQRKWFKDEIDKISTWEYEDRYSNDKDLIV